MFGNLARGWKCPEVFQTPVLRMLDQPANFQPPFGKAAIEQPLIFCRLGRIAVHNEVGRDVRWLIFLPRACLPGKKLQRQVNYSAKQVLHAPGLGHMKCGVGKEGLPGSRKNTPQSGNQARPFPGSKEQDHIDHSVEYLEEGGKEVPVLPLAKIGAFWLAQHRRNIGFLFQGNPKPILWNRFARQFQPLFARRGPILPVEAGIRAQDLNPGMSHPRKSTLIQCVTRNQSGTSRAARIIAASLARWHVSAKSR